ncbi:MAG: hypothetical protein AAFX56_09135 [Pseudomonadota bacterium]
MCSAEAKLKPSNDGNEHLRQRKNEAIARGQSVIAAVYSERGRNTELWDALRP